MREQGKEEGVSVCRARRGEECVHCVWLCCIWLVCVVMVCDSLVCSVCDCNTCGTCVTMCFCVAVVCVCCCAGCMLHMLLYPVCGVCN